MATDNNFIDVPGARHVKYLKNKGSEYYCTKHKMFVWPLFVRHEHYTYPTCEDCFLEDLQARGKFIGDYEEIDGVEKLAGDLVAEAILETDNKGCVPSNA